MCLRRMKNSLRIVRCALFPARGKDETLSSPTEGVVVITPETAPCCLADLGRLADAQGELRLFFPDCFALVAPFLLFRLKREGFSGCRAFMENGGLMVSARR